jgi:hypothetical protein
VLGRRSVAKEPALEIESDGDNDNAHSELQFEIEEQQCAGRNRAGRVLRYLLQICSKSKPSSVVLVACIVLRALILRVIVRDVECSWDGVEVGIRCGEVMARLE